MAGVKEIIRNCQHYYERVEELLNKSGSELNSRDKFYSRLLKREVKFCLKWKDHQGYLFPEANFLDGLQTTLPKLFGSEDILRLVRSHYIIVAASPRLKTTTGT